MSVVRKKNCVLSLPLDKPGKGTRTWLSPSMFSSVHLTLDREAISRKWDNDQTPLFYYATVLALTVGSISAAAGPPSV